MRRSACTEAKKNVLSPFRTTLRNQCHSHFIHAEKYLVEGSIINLGRANLALAEYDSTKETLILCVDNGGTEGMLLELMKVDLRSVCGRLTAAMT